MHQRVSVLKRPSLVIPEGFVKIVLENNKTCAGAAMVNGGILDVVRLAESPSVSQVMDIQNTQLDKTVLFHFGNFPAGFLNDDVQPFTLLEDGKNNPLVIAYLDGDFGGFDKAGTSHDPAFFVVNEYLRPTCMEIFEMCSKDIKKFMELMDSPMNRRNVLNTILTKGMINLMSPLGGVSYVKGEAKHEFPWGFTSQNYGYGEVPKEEAKPEEKKSGLAALGARVITALTPAAKDAGITAPKTDTAVELVTSAKLPPGITIEGGRIYAQCPEGQNYNSKNQKKQWYTKYTGAAPNNVHSRPKVEILDVGKIRSLGDLAVAILQAQQTKAGKDVSTPVVSAVSPLQPKAVGATKDATQEVPILSQTMQKAVVEQFLGSDIVKKTIGKNGEIFDPSTLDIDTKLPTFSEQVGIDLETTFRWDFRIDKCLCKDYPEAAALLMLEYRNLYLKMLQAHPDSAPAPKVDLPADTPEVPASPPEVKPSDEPKEKFAFAM